MNTEIERLEETLLRNDLVAADRLEREIRARFVECIHAGDYAELGRLQVDLGQALTATATSERSTSMSVRDRLDELLAFGRAFLQLAPPLVSLDAHDIGVLDKLVASPSVDEAEFASERERQSLAHLSDVGIVKEIQGERDDGEVAGWYELTAKGRRLAQKCPDLPTPRLATAIEVVTDPRVGGIDILKVVFRDMPSDGTPDDLASVAEMLRRCGLVLAGSSRLVLALFGSYAGFLSGRLRRVYSDERPRLGEGASPSFRRAIFKEFTQNTRDFIGAAEGGEDTAAYLSLVNLIYLADVFSTIPQETQCNMTDVFEDAVRSIRGDLDQLSRSAKVGDLFSPVVAYNLKAANVLFTFGRSFPHLPMSTEAKARVEDQSEEITEFLRCLVTSYGNSEAEALFRWDGMLLRRRRELIDYYPSKPLRKYAIEKDFPFVLN